jgi:hypothetical protein
MAKAAHAGIVAPAKPPLPVSSQQEVEMRIMKIVGLAMVVAISMMAFAGVASAVAKPTGLCSKNEETCAKGNTYYSSPTILANWASEEAPGTYGKLVMPTLGTVTCVHSKFQAELTNSEGPLVGKLIKWWFLSCGPAGCTMETGEGELPSYAAQLTATGGGDGSLTVTKPRLIVNCTSPLKYKCIYETSSMGFTVEGATSEEGGAYTSSAAKVSRVTLGSNPFCPATAEFISHYRALEPGPSLFVTYR